MRNNIHYHDIIQFLFGNIAWLVILFMGLSMAACGGPTQEMGSSSTPVSTAEISTMPTHTSTPIPTPTPEVELVQLPAGNCAHPYYPVVEGRTLTYLNDNLSPNQFSISFVDVSSDAFAMKLERGQDIDKLVTWTCNSQGLLSPEFLEAFTGLQDMELVIDEADGQTLIDYGRMVLGSEWSTNYTGRAMGTVETPSGRLLIDFDVSLDHQVAAKEPVSTKAGDFSESYRIDSQGTYRVALSLGDEEIQADERSLVFSTWYVENLGMVKQEFFEGWSPDEVGTSSVSELVAVD